MKTTTTFKIILLAALAFQLEACQYKKEDRAPHEQGHSTAVQTDENKASINAELEKTDLQQIYQKLGAAKSETELIAILDGLENLVLNQENINNFYTSKNNKQKTALGYYNYALIKLADIKTATSKTVLNQRIEKYQKLLTHGCDINLIGCDNISYFKADQRSSDIAVLIAENLKDKDVKEYYNTLGIAYDLNNNTRNQKLDLLYIQRANEYAGLQNQNPEFIKKHGHIFEAIISQIPTETKDQQFSEFVKKFKPWNYSRLNENVFPFGIQQIFRFAANNFLYSEDKKTLDADLKKTIVDSQNQADKTGTSFIQSIKELESNKQSAMIFTNLGMDTSKIKDPAFLNEYFFIVDRLFRGHWGIEEANSVWQGSKREQTKLLDVVSLYTKVEFIKLVVETNKQISENLSKKDVANDQLFKQVIQKSEPLAKTWGQTLSRMENISIFVTQQLRNASTADSSQLKAIQLIIDSVKKNGSYISTFPNMLMLAYFMVERDASMTFDTMWGSISIDPAKIMTDLLGGTTPVRWFNYTGDSTTLNKIENIYSLYFTMISGSFETFSVLKDNSGKPILNKSMFFRKAIKKSILSELTYLNEYYTSLMENSESDNQFKALMEVCNNELSKNKNYTIDTPLDELQNYALFGNADRGLLKPALKFYSSNGPIGQWRNYRESFEIKLTQIKAMANILRMHFEKDKNVENEIALKQLNLEIAQIENLKKSFAKELFAQHKKLSKCTNHLTNLESERQTILFNAEIKHLGEVYEHIKNPKESKTKLALEPGESITAENYAFNRYALLKRFSKYAENIKPSVNFLPPNDDTKNKLEAQIDKVSTLDPNTMKLKSKEDFISDVMALYNPLGNSSILWLQETTKIESWQNKIENIIELYKLGYDTNLQSDAKNSVSASEIIQDVVDLANYIDIKDYEKPWLKMMSLKERVPREKLKGLLFANSESDFIALFDSFYDKIASLQYTLDEATSFYLTKKNQINGRFLFPPAEAINDVIAKEYKELFNRTEDMVTDFNATIKKMEPSFKNLKITYRLEGNNQINYTTDLLDGGNSVLLDVRRTNNLDAILYDFHMRKTDQYFKRTDKK
jgi:hypothetical protein